MTSTSVTAKFIKVFDAKNETHVKWLGAMFDMAESMSDPSAHIKLVKSVNENPMGVKLDQRDALDWPHIHFALSTVYAKEVWNCRAWIPTKN
jgi:hypothetical protein